MATDFTAVDKLGPDTGESDYASFDDFDDFHNYTVAETTMQNVYQISCRVCYVHPNYPDLPIANRSFYKKLTVTVKNPVKNDSLALSYVHGFWYFN